MNIAIRWFSDQFNVELSSSGSTEAFLTIKGCRLASGANGPFVSYPATKNATTNKWWQHVWGSDKFNAAVLEKAQASQPQQQQRSGGRQQRGQDMDDSIPF
jgi:hypothetical protein